MNKVPVNITEEEYMIWISDVRSMGIHYNFIISIYDTVFYELKCMS